MKLAVEGVPVGKATMQLVAPGDLSARYTLEDRDAVRPWPAPVAREGGALKLMLPPISCGIVEIELEQERAPTIQ